jgi:predicted lipid-binding transport protein (Tim44 family)
MSGGIPYIDILIFAIIAIFLGLRLHSVLGKRTGFEQENPRDQDMVAAVTEGSSKVQTIPLNGTGIDAIMKADPSFSDVEFVNGASSAYGMILESFAGEDIEALKPLLGYEMNSSFAEAIRERQKAGEMLSITLVDLEKAEISNARLVDGLAMISVDFQSSQKRLLRAEDGSVLDGGGDEAETFRDRWTFERDISSRDPNWLLVETETIDP